MSESALYQHHVELKEKGVFYLLRAGYQCRNVIGGYEYLGERPATLEDAKRWSCFAKNPLVALAEGLFVVEGGKLTRIDDVLWPSPKNYPVVPKLPPVSASSQRCHRWREKVFTPLKEYLEKYRTVEEANLLPLLVEFMGRGGNRVYEYVNMRTGYSIVIDQQGYLRCGGPQAFCLPSNEELHLWFHEYARADHVV